MTQAAKATLGIPARRPGFCSTPIRDDEWRVREILDSCVLSRHELARTICEALGWVRPKGGLKARECYEYLEAPSLRTRASCRHAVLPQGHKQQLIRLIQDQPNDSPYEEILRELAFAPMAERGVADSDAGRAISSDEMARRIESWRRWSSSTARWTSVST